MALLMLLVYLMCNVLLAWAMLQQPYVSKTLSSPPPQNKNDWVHLVIFEPQLKIQITQSSYKITLFLDFHYLFILGIPNIMALLMLLVYLMCNVLLAWATLQQPYVSKILSSPPTTKQK